MNIKQELIFKVIAALALAGSFCSCTIEKRRYFKGYDIEWKQRAAQVTEQKKQQRENVTISDNQNPVGNPHLDAAQISNTAPLQANRITTKKHLLVKPKVKYSTPEVYSHPSNVVKDVAPNQQDYNNGGNKKMNRDDRLLLTGGILGDISVLLLLVSYYVLGVVLLPFTLVALLFFAAGAIFITIGGDFHGGRGEGFAIAIVYALVIAITPFVGIYYLIKAIVNSGKTQTATTQLRQ